MKTVVVTGASFGIGKAIAKKLSEDFNVIAVARSLENLNEIKSDSIDCYQLDITDESKVKIFESYIADKGVIALINNAGGGFGSSENFLNEDMDIWKKVYDLNVVGTMNMTKAVAPEIIKNGGGNVVVITSVSGHFIYKKSGSYTIAKHAEVVLSDMLRLELADKNIRVTEIAPGSVNSNYDKNAIACLSPEDIADAVKWSIEVPPHVNVEKISITHVNNLSR
jgi:NADP-dependent 3-hydroxy acid dehydrogenase YdfG